MIILPFPPSLNSAYAGKARRHKSKAYKKWLANLSRLDTHNIDYPVKISYNMYLPGKHNRDISNYIKLIEDYLVSQKVLKDDNYKIVQEINIKCCGIDRENPRVEIEIERGD